jgi:hypothetical protein
LQKIIIFFQSLVTNFESDLKSPGWPPLYGILPYLPLPIVREGEVKMCKVLAFDFPLSPCGRGPGRWGASQENTLSSILSRQGRGKEVQGFSL